MSVSKRTCPVCTFYVRIMSKSPGCGGANGNSQVDAIVGAYKMAVAIVPVCVGAASGILITGCIALQLRARLENLGVTTPEYCSIVATIVVPITVSTIVIAMYTVSAANRSMSGSVETQ